MKKFFGVFLVTVLAWGLICADTVVPSINVLGLIEIDSRNPYLPIAIPFDEASVSKGQRISVADVVLTASLSVGDELYAYDHDSKRYFVYTLVYNKDTKINEWQANGVKEISASGSTDSPIENANDLGLATGYGFWLHRIGPSTNNIVQVMGQLTEKAQLEIKGGEYALLGAVGDEDIDLTSTNPTNNPFASKAVQGDRIEVPQADGSLSIYTYRKTTGWNALMRGKTVEPLKSGWAFWYLRKQGAAPLDVSWIFPEEDDE